MISASQAIFRSVAAGTGPVNVKIPVPGPASLSAVSRSALLSGASPGIGGGVHDGEQMLVLVLGGEDFHMLQPVL
jgi:hypothetical protein